MISNLTNKKLVFKYLILVLLSVFKTTAFSQVQVIKGGGMTDSTSWFIYNLESVNKAKREFNYTLQKPLQGVNGCLRITSANATSILLWQKLSVKAGETYAIDGAIKTNNVASFWSEITLSNVPPVEGVDYLPNNGADLVQGFSTWVGCGPNINGLFSADACNGKKKYTVPGVAGTSVDIYYGLKIGSMANPMPNDLEVLIDELKMTRDVNVGNDITAVSLGTIDIPNLNIKIPSGIRAAQLKSSLSVSPYSSFKVLNNANSEVSNITAIDNTMKILVTSENGISKTFAIQTSLPGLTLETLNNLNANVVDYNTRNIDISGASNITITGLNNPIKGSILNLKSDNIWIYFPNIRPSLVYKNICPQILLNGAVAVVDQNIRVEEYLEGTMLISQPITYQALQLFAAENLAGTSFQLNINNYYRAAQLGTFNTTAKSFRLKKGYMATLAQNEDGSGISKVYIAYDNDIVINKLPVGLYNDVSFIRVLPWRWVAKKGWTSGLAAAEALNAHWQYDWDNASTSTLDVEYVPMRHNKNWNSYANINNKLKSTHALGYNEPDRPDQANATVDEAIAAWPEMQKSGLRLGSPCPSDAGPGLTWLYSFIDKADALNYRVDFVAVHWYKGGQTARQFYDWLKGIHVRTKRPIWITEWNNGANWTCCTPTFAQQQTTIGEIINMLDTASFVERYSLYEWVGNTRQMFLQNPVSLSPAGIVYSNNTSPLAYNPNKVNNIITGVDEVVEETKTEGLGLIIFPNPIENKVFFQSLKPILSVLITDITGHQIVNYDQLENNSIYLNNLDPGIYLMNIWDGQKTWIKKFIKR
ncbi:MAG: T9SS type A sorting domain-containing protein [Opitutaceae bacterium]|nr:T9SS type A sorting domain-containing protein [Cytophagales bacterium]